MSLGRTVIAALRALRTHLSARNAVAWGSVVAASFTLANATQDANANGETRSLTMFHSHTSESITITYKRNGSFDSGALEKLNWFLRDWRIDEPTSMAPQLFDVIWYAYREIGASDPIRIMSAYRSPGTNAMLRRRSRAVAKESQHMRGNAMDIHIPGVSMAKVREIGMRLQRGGVGYYPSAGSPFVHLDVGSVRSWPRMPREQLERLFPDGKTVHLPADGIPLANYQAALAEVQARGGSALDYDTVTTNRGKSLWALLFGGDEDEDSSQPAARGRNTRVAAARGGRGGAQPVEQVAALSPSGDNPMAAGVVAYAAPAAPARSVRSAPIAAPAPVAEEEPAPAPKQAAPAPAAAPQLQIASLPVPPIRPKGAQLEKLIAASEPLPPIRPAGLATLVAGLPQQAAPVSEAMAAAVAAPAPVAVSGMPLPPLRPAAAPVVVAAIAPPAPAPVLQASNLPAPPVRPAFPAPAEKPAPEKAALPAIMSRAEPAAPAVAPAQAYAAIAAPLPPSRPMPAQPRPVATAAVPAAPVAAPAGPVVAPPPPRPPVQAKATNPNALLATRPEAQTRPARVTAVAEPPVEREVKSGVVAMKFGQGAPQSPGGAGFGGSFIRPLGASFTKTGE